MPKKGSSSFDSYSARVKKVDAAVTRILKPSGSGKTDEQVGRRISMDKKAAKSPKKTAAKEAAMKSAKSTVAKNESRFSSTDRAAAKAKLSSKASRAK